MTEYLNQAYCWFLNETSIYLKAITLPIIIGSIYKLVKYTFNKYINYLSEKSLFPYYTNSFVENSQKKYIRTKCQNIDPANEISLMQSFAFATKEDLLNFFIGKVFKVRENENRFYLILADSGMGKTTFLLNLFIRYSSFLNYKINKKNIKLLPLGESFETTSKNIINITDPKNTILLLDGFDELPTTDNESILNRFDELIDQVKNFSIVLISCRTHFFSSESDEPFELKVKKYNTNGNGFHIIKKIYISPFDKKDIQKYLNKTFYFYEYRKKRTAYEVVDKTVDLMVRPMLLSYIEDIVNTRNTYFTTNFDIYESLINSWVIREANKYPENEQWEFKLNLIYFSYAVSDFIYNNYEKNGVYIPLIEAKNISDSFKIDLNDIEIKSRSLLNRNSKGDYKFSHKSIYEFFLAYNAYNERLIKSDNNVIKYTLENYDVAKGFIEDIITSKRHKFILPKMHDNFSEINTELYQNILQARNNSTKIIWVSGNSFQIVK